MIRDFTGVISLEFWIQKELGKSIEFVLFEERFHSVDTSTYSALH